jgi:hypothetical protein
MTFKKIVKYRCHDLPDTDEYQYRDVIRCDVCKKTYMLQRAMYKGEWRQYWQLFTIDIKDWRNEDGSKLSMVQVQGTQWTEFREL